MSPRTLKAVGHIAPGSRTARVRIAVAVSSDGEWVATGENGEPDEDLRAEVLDGMASFYPVHVVWVEADCPLPTERTVEGRVG